jgi:hypothetical protein
MVDKTLLLMGALSLLRPDRDDSGARSIAHNRRQKFKIDVFFPPSALLFNGYVGAWLLFMFQILVCTEPSL